MTQLNGGFISNSINRCFDVCSTIICVWHNNDKRNTMMHPIYRWSYKLERVSKFIILFASLDSTNPSCTVGSGCTQSRHVCGGQPIHPKQSLTSVGSSAYHQSMFPHLTIIRRHPHRKNVATSSTLLIQKGEVSYMYDVAILEPN